MDFPVSQDTWVRKENRNLVLSILGDDLDAQDYADWADWLEAFQDILGYNILGGYGTLVERLDDIPSEGDVFVFALLGGL